MFCSTEGNWVRAFTLGSQGCVQHGIGRHAWGPVRAGLLPKLPQLGHAILLTLPLTGPVAKGISHDFARGCVLAGLDGQTYLGDHFRR
jgi:hypothetical protein